MMHDFPVSAMPPTQERLFLVTSPGVGPVLEREARALGFEVESADATGVAVRGPAGSHRRACLWLRTANHVRLRLWEGRATRPEELKALAAKHQAELAAVWKSGTPVVWNVTSKRSRVSAQDAKRALESTLGAGASTAPLIPSGDAQHRSRGTAGVDLHLRLDQDVATLSVDCSGEDLYKRGYRQEISRAPMRETLAAAILMLAGYDGTAPLWDPMCGSGTLVIEGAWIALNRAPGSMREFAFQNFAGFDAQAWARELAEAKAQERAGTLPPIRGTDIHAGSLGVARRNARRAQVLERIQLERVDAIKLPVQSGPPGLVVANLPYGKRVNEQADLKALYRGFGQSLRTGFRGWTAALFLEDEQLGEALGLPGREAIPLDNGGLRCVLWLANLR